MYAGVFTDVKEFNKYQLVRKCIHPPQRGIGVTNIKTTGTNHVNSFYICTWPINKKNFR